MRAVEFEALLRGLTEEDPVRRELKREQAQSLADALLSAIKREGG